MDDSVNSTPRSLLRGFMAEASPHHTPAAFKKDAESGSRSSTTNEPTTPDDLRKKLLRRRSKLVSEDDDHGKKVDVSFKNQSMGLNFTYANVSDVSSASEGSINLEKEKLVLKRKQRGIASSQPLPSERIHKNISLANITYAGVSDSDASLDDTIIAERGKIAKRKRGEILPSSQPVGGRHATALHGKSSSVTLPMDYTYASMESIESSVENIDVDDIKKRRRRNMGYVTQSTKQDNKAKLGYDNQNMVLNEETVGEIDGTYHFNKLDESSSNESLDINAIRQRKKKFKVDAARARKINMQDMLSVQTDSDTLHLSPDSASLASETTSPLNSEAQRLGHFDESGESLVSPAASPRRASPKSASPRRASPKTASPRRASPKTASPRRASPKTASPRRASLKTASPRHASPKTASPRRASPKTASPRRPSPKTASPLRGSLKTESPLRASPKMASSLASPKTASPRRASPKTASPRRASPKTASPRRAFSKTASPHRSSPKFASPRIASPKTTSPSRAPQVPSPVTSSGQEELSTSPTISSSPPHSSPPEKSRSHSRLSITTPLRATETQAKNTAILLSRSKFATETSRPFEAVDSRSAPALRDSGKKSLNPINEDTSVAGSPRGNVLVTPRAERKSSSDMNLSESLNSDRSLVTASQQVKSRNLASLPRSKTQLDMAALIQNALHREAESPRSGDQIVSSELQLEKGDTSSDEAGSDQSEVPETPDSHHMIHYDSTKVSTRRSLVQYFHKSRAAREVSDGAFVSIPPPADFKDNINVSDLGSNAGFQLTVGDSVSPRRTSVAASPRRTSVAASPRRTSVAASPRRTSVAASPRRTSAAASPRQNSVAASPRRSLVASSPRPVPTSIVEESRKSNISQEISSGSKHTVITRHEVPVPGTSSGEGVRDATAVFASAVRSLAEEWDEDEDELDVVGIDESPRVNKSVVQSQASLSSKPLSPTEMLSEGERAGTAFTLEKSPKSPSKTRSPVKSKPMKQMSIQDFLQFLDKNDYVAPGEAEKKRKLEEEVRMTLMKPSGEQVASSKPRPSPKKESLKSKKVKLWKTLPYKYHKESFNNFSRRIYSKAVINEAVKASEVFFANLISDLSEVATARNHSAIQETDVVYLMRKQGLIEDSDHSLNALAEQFLPINEWPHLNKKK